jgi:hypothetical protein
LAWLNQLRHSLVVAEVVVVVTEEAVVTAAALAEEAFMAVVSMEASLAVVSTVEGFTADFTVVRL